MGKNGDFNYQYNGQISVDEDNQIIVGQHLSQNANDKKEVEPALDAYIATNKGEKKNKTPLDESNRKLSKADFVFNEQDDCFICPGGQTLILKSTSKDGKKRYQGSTGTCNNCNYQSRCCKSATGQARTINTDDKEPIRQQMNE